MKKALILLILLFFIGIGFLIKYINFTSNYVESNAAFVKSENLVNLSFKLAGRIEDIFVKEGDRVKKGELLAKLDTKELEFQKEKLKNQIRALNKKIEATTIQKDKLSSDINNNIKILFLQKEKLKNQINSYKYMIKAGEVKLDKLKRDVKRFENLFKEHKISREKFENTKTAYLALLNEIESKREVLNSLKKDLKVLDLKIKIANNSKKEIKRLRLSIEAMQKDLNSLKDELKIINNHIKDSYLYAPFDGKIAKKFANSDEIVGSSRRIFSIVDLNSLYVLDLIEETKLKDIKVGCPVKIHIDALDKDVKGRVSKILPASAATFAILPRDISSGEFTKLAQRFYLKIKFNKVPKDALVGMSAEVVIEKCNK
jgi:membrane fusion protein (multidrug efflux system)